MKKKFKAPFILPSKIKEQVSFFREKHCSNKIPVEIEKIIEQKLKIEIIPVPNLKKLCFVDAFITSDWKKIVVDNDKYMDERYYNRLRFSYAHEIGHAILHKDLYASLGINDFPDFYDFIDKIDQDEYRFIESHANSFAAHLLIPDERLLKEKEKLLFNKNIPPGIDNDTLNNVLAGILCEKFGVSAEALENALKRSR